MFCFSKISQIKKYAKQNLWTFFQKCYLTWHVIVHRVTFELNLNNGWRKTRTFDAQLINMREPSGIENKKRVLQFLTIIHTFLLWWNIETWTVFFIYCLLKHHYSFYLISKIPIWNYMMDFIMQSQISMLGFWSDDIFEKNVQSLYIYFLHISK